MINVLMVGGPCDGRRVQAVEGTKFIRLAVPQSRGWLNFRSKIEHEPTYREIEYRIVMEMGQNAVAAEYGVGAEGAFALLLEGYRAEVQP